MIEPVHFPPYNGDRKKYNEDNRLAWAGDEDAKRRIAEADAGAHKRPDVLLARPKRPLRLSKQARLDAIARNHERIVKFGRKAKLEVVGGV